MSVTLELQVSGTKRLVQGRARWSSNDEGQPVLTVALHDPEGNHGNPVLILPETVAEQLVDGAEHGSQFFLRLA